MKNKIFFIVSAPRSGSTSLATICNDAKNCICLVEPHNSGRIISRDLMDGKPVEGSAWIKKYIVPNAKRYLKKTEIYAEKDYVYGPLIPYLYEIFECKFVFIKRDGREFVTSRINKHEQKDGSCYRECAEDSFLSDTAKQNATKNIAGGDTGDYSRPRPLPGEFLFDSWAGLSRAEMCAFYWAKVNEFHTQELARIPKNRQVTVNYSSENLIDDIMRMVDFLHLVGLSKQNVQKRLNQRINSLARKGINTGNYPHWKQWSQKQTEKFNKIAGGMMKELGYYG